MALARRIALLAFSLVGPAHAVAAQEPRIHDSAGIRIVENPSIENLPVRFRLAATPELVVGGVRDKEDEELDAHSGLFAALLLPGNHLLVADNDKLKLFDGSGKLLHILGRSGAGPGEFRRVTSLCRFAGDSVLAWDFANRRISVWSGNGKFVREYPSPGLALGADGCSATGSILVEGERSESQSDVPLTSYLVVSSRGTAVPTPQPLPTRLYAGAFVREIQFGGFGNDFVVGDEITLGARILDRTGKVVRIFRTADRPDPVTASNLADRAMACTPDRTTGKCTPVPSKTPTWPAYFRMLVDDAGRSWFRLNGKGNDSTWVAFDSTGRTIGKLVMPAAPVRSERTIGHMGNDQAVVVDRDSDGARRVSVFRILAVP